MRRISETNLKREVGDVRGKSGRGVRGCKGR